MVAEVLKAFLLEILEPVLYCKKTRAKSPFQSPFQFLVLLVFALEAPINNRFRVFRPTSMLLLKHWPLFKRNTRTRHDRVLCQRETLAGNNSRLGGATVALQTPMRPEGNGNYRKTPFPGWRMSDQAEAPLRLGKGTFSLASLERSKQQRFSSGIIKLGIAGLYCFASQHDFHIFGPFPD